MNRFLTRCASAPISGVCHRHRHTTTTTAAAAAAATTTTAAAAAAAATTTAATESGSIIHVLRLQTDIECYGERWRRDLATPLVGFVVYCVLCPLLPFLLSARALPLGQTASLNFHSPLLFDSYHPQYWCADERSAPRGA